MTLVNTVDVDYFKTLGVVVRVGREFEPRDRADAPPVAIVNETMAAKYWPGQNPIGRRLQLEGDPAPREIVGVVKTTKYQTLGEAAQPCAFVPLAQNYADAMTLYVRTTGDPGSILDAIRRQVRLLGTEYRCPTVPPSIRCSISRCGW